MKNVLFVCGKFDLTGGKPSRYMEKISSVLENNINCEFTTLNGGYYDALVTIISNLAEFDAIWWMPDIDNSLSKLVDNIKDKAKKSVLVISKNNSSGKYQYIDLVGRMLAARANLSLIIESSAPFHATLLDPLGNAFCQNESNVGNVADALLKRTLELMSFTRMGSVQVGETIHCPENDDTRKFFEIVRNYAGVFHELVHGVNPSRFLGNVSYRCTRGGFPALRVQDMIYISRRNLDKRDISTDGFVAVRANDAPQIEYYGPKKPSVDAPIQRALFNALPHVKYMLHSHTYIKDAPYTDTLVPCGALEEVEEVLKYARETPYINLTGHGCLILAERIDQLENIPFINRPLPEICP